MKTTERKQLPRFRWYHSLVIAGINGIVILASIYAYNRTVSSASLLIEQTQDLSNKSRSLHLLQQRLLELNSPVNDVFRTKDQASARQEFEVARQNVRAALESAGPLQTPGDSLLIQVERMIASSQDVFSQFERMAARNQPAPQREEAFATAGGALARVNEELRETIRTLDLSIALNASQRDDLLQRHERDLNSRAAVERYFIAGVVVALAGIFWFAWRLQKATQALVAERQERLAAIGELASSVAHGIRNPLAAIRMSAQLVLKRGVTDEILKQRLEDILQESKRLGDRVTGLLGMARAPNADRESLDLNEIVRQTSNELLPRFAEKELTLQSIEAEEPLTVLGDRGQLEQVVIELLSNAFEHSRTGETVTVTCRRLARRGLAAISVEDQGPGVPDVIRTRIFDLFFTTKPEGTGIGLATIKRYARVHGGDVLLENAASGGARFVVHLPLAGERGQPAKSGLKKERFEFLRQVFLKRRATAPAIGKGPSVGAP